jgi:uncharacterized protein (TIGR03086 family)
MSEMSSEAARHRRIAATFTDRVRGTADWDAPSPVPDWRARDVVGHLTTWFPGFLAAGGVELEPGPSVDNDPVAAWTHHADVVQQMLDGDDATREFTHPHVGAMPLALAIDRFYTSDVFMHTWDLARATGQDDTLDPDECQNLLAGMEPMEQVLRDSGQYGPRVEVPDDASVQDRLIGFIGRDPAWRPGGGLAGAE